MPAKPDKKGGKRIRRGKKLPAGGAGGGNDGTTSTKSVPLAEGDQQYARVVSRLGDARLKVITADGQEYIGVIRGKFKKRVWMNKDDIIVIDTRSYENVTQEKLDDGKLKADVIHKYQPVEVKQLIRKGAFPRSLLSDDNQGDDDADDGLAWAMPKSDDEESDGDGEGRVAIPAQPDRKFDITSEDDESSSCDLEDL